MIKVGVMLANIILAQTACEPGDTMQKRLSQANQEQMIFSGSIANGSLIELWANFDAGTWSILNVRQLDTKTTLTCMLAFGDGANVRRPERPGTPL